MDQTIKGLYEVILSRKEERAEGSYTAYLFEKGVDKILKKCGEECAEVIIAAKNKRADETVNEVCDLLYHLMVLLAEQEIPLEDVEAELERRRKKIGNLKAFRETDRNT